VKNKKKNGYVRREKERKSGEKSVLTNQVKKESHFAQLEKRSQLPEAIV